MEVVTPDTREQINTVLDALRRDKEKSRRMLPDGSYVREKGGEGTSSQEALYRYFSAWKVGTEAPKPAAPVSAPAIPAPRPAAPAPIVAPPKALETPPTQEHAGFLQKLRSFFS